MKLSLRPWGRGSGQYDGRVERSSKSFREVGEGGSLPEEGQVSKTVEWRGRPGRSGRWGKGITTYLGK